MIETKKVAAVVVQNPCATPELKADFLYKLFLYGTVISEDYLTRLVKSAGKDGGSLNPFKRDFLKACGVKTNEKITVTIECDILGNWDEDSVKSRLIENLALVPNHNKTGFRVSDNSHVVNPNRMKITNVTIDRK